MKTLDNPFEWYTVVESNKQLEQGDLLNNFPIIIPPNDLIKSTNLEEGSELIGSSPIRKYNVVVMTQSCDLIKFKDDDVIILCPLFNYLDIVKDDPKFGKDRWGNLINGREIHTHVLNQCTIKNYEFDYQLVNLEKVFSVPYWLVKGIAQSQEHRVRLQPPYREHLAYAFAQQFMRIGLPADLPNEYPYST
jgi:hypothetical protein